MEVVHKSLKDLIAEKGKRYFVSNENIFITPSMFKEREEIKDSKGNFIKHGKLIFDKSCWTIFEFKPFKQIEVTEFRIAYSAMLDSGLTEKERTNGYNKSVEILLSKFVSVKNLYDCDGNVIQIDSENKKSLIDYIELPLLNEIVIALLMKNGLSKEDRQGLTF